MRVHIFSVLEYLTLSSYLACNRTLINVCRCLVTRLFLLNFKLDVFSIFIDSNIDYNYSHFNHSTVDIKAEVDSAMKTPKTLLKMINLFYFVL